MVEELQNFVTSTNIACGWNEPYDLLGFRRVTDRLHIGNRWMAQSGFNTYDNTARMHYPLLPSFDVPDPLSQDYPSLSPYSHCAGNPLSLIDPTGMFIIGSDKKHIEYDEVKHTLVGNLTKIQQTALTPMLLTNTGTQKLLEMLDTSYEILLVDGVTFEPKAASTRTSTKKNESTGKDEIDYVKIEFYRDNIEGELKKDPMYNETGLTDNERWGAVATHEACHAIYKEANREFESSQDKREDIARKYEQQYIDEIKKNREKK